MNEGSGTAGGVVASIYRYPIKGLAGQALQEAHLSPGAAIEADRRYAIKHGDSVFDPDNPVHLSKTKFLALMTHEEMAQFETEFDNSGHGLTLRRGGNVVFDGDLRDALAVKRLETLMADHVGARAKGTPKLVSARGHMFSDVPEKCVSVVNLASVDALSILVDASLDPLRFRANLHLEGVPAWSERDWEPGMQFRAGSALLEVMKPIVRCNATNVNLQSAEIDQNLPKILMKETGANLMGVYCQVVAGGTVAVGQPFAAA